MNRSLEPQIENMSYDSEKLASMNASDVRRKHTQHSQLLDALKKSLYCGTAFHSSLAELVNKELGGVLNESLRGNTTANNNAHMSHSNNYAREDYRKLASDFNLYEYVKHDKDADEHADVHKYIATSIPRIRRLSKTERDRAINTYLQKRANRNKEGQVRYQVRKDLAVGRKRVKGKFVKDRKIDIKRAAAELMKDFANFNLTTN